MLVFVPGVCAGVCADVCAGCLRRVFVQGALTGTLPFSPVAQSGSAQTPHKREMGFSEQML